jgi:hypothetical protein
MPEPEKVLMEHCVCGNCFYCPDGWHQGTGCACTPDCLLGDATCPECGLESVKDGVCRACGVEVAAA